MSNIAIKGAATGTGVFTLESPATNTNRTLTLPDVTATVITDSAGVLDIGSGQVYKDASGNVGIGTTSLPYRLSVTPPNVTLTGVGIDLFRSGSLTSNVGGVLNFRPPLGTTTNDLFNLSICAYDHSGDQNADGLSINGADGVSFSTGGNSRNERMRIDSNGRIQVNGTYVVDVARISVSFNGADSTGIGIIATSASGGTLMKYLNSGGSQVGAITTNASSTSYLTSSDYRLKEEWVAVADASTRVNALKPVNFAWKLNGERVDGFLAHELAEVVPEAVAGAKDAMRDEEYEVSPAVLDDDGNVVTPAVMGTRSVPDYQGIDQSKLVPLLTAALQEALARIETLEADVATLKGAA